MSDNVVDLTAIITERRVIDDAFEDLIEEMVDADLLIDNRPDGLMLTPFAARIAWLIVHHIEVYAQRHGLPWREPADVGSAALSLEEALNPGRSF